MEGAKGATSGSGHRTPKTPYARGCTGLATSGVSCRRVVRKRTPARRLLQDESVSAFSVIRPAYNHNTHATPYARKPPVADCESGMRELSNYVHCPWTTDADNCILINQQLFT